MSVDLMVMLKVVKMVCTMVASMAVMTAYL
jgi:hypothetical protein